MTVTNYLDIVTIPGLDTTTAATGVPKSTSTIFADKDPLRFNPNTGFWEGCGVGSIGQAYSDGAYGMGVTTCNIQVRPILVLPVFGKADNFAGSAYVYKAVEKITGTAWSTLAANVYQNGDPASATFGQHSTTFTAGWIVAGYVAVTAAAGDTVGIIQRYVQFPMVPLAKAQTDTPYPATTYSRQTAEGTTYQKSASCPAVTANDSIFAELDGSGVTNAAFTGGRGKVYLGKAVHPSSAGVGDLLVQYNFSSTGHWLSDWLQLQHSMRNVCFVSTSIAEGQVSSFGNSYYFRANHAQNVTTGLIDYDQYEVWFAQLQVMDLRITTAVNPTRFVPSVECAFEFDYAQIVHAAAHFPADCVMVCKTDANPSSEYPTAIVPTTAPAGYTSHEFGTQPRYVTDYQLIAGAALRDTYPQKAYARGGGKRFAQLVITANGTTTGAYSITGVTFDFNIIRIDGSTHRTITATLTLLGTQTIAGTTYTAWAYTYTSIPANWVDETIGETYNTAINYSFTGGAGTKNVSGSATLNSCGNYPWPCLLMTRGGLASSVGMLGYTVDSTNPLTAPTVTGVPTVTLSTVGVDTQIRIDMVFTASYAAQVNRNANTWRDNGAPSIALRRSSDGLWFDGTNFHRQFYLVQGGLLSSGVNTRTYRWTLLMRNIGPATFNLNGFVIFQSYCSADIDAFATPYWTDRFELSPITVPVT